MMLSEILNIGKARKWSCNFPGIFTLRNTDNPNSLFILNFDEHGGFADHVPPPVNIPAPGDVINFAGVSDGHNVTYDFTRLGVR